VRPGGNGEDLKKTHVIPHVEPGHRPRRLPFGRDIAEAVNS